MYQLRTMPARASGVVPVPRGQRQHPGAGHGSSGPERAWQEHGEGKIVEHGSHTWFSCASQTPQKRRGQAKVFALLFDNRHQATYWGGTRPCETDFSICRAC